MGSMPSITPGVANLLQTLTKFDSPLLSSPNVVSALKQASPTDILKLSAEATQLEGVSLMFGESETASNGVPDLTTTLGGLEASSAASVFPGGAGDPQSASADVSTSPASISPASQLAAYQTTMQAAETEALLGTGSPGIPSDSLFSFLG